MIPQKIRAGAMVFLMGAAAVAAAGVLVAAPAEAAIRSVVGNPLNDAKAAMAAGNCTSAMAFVRKAEAAGGLTAAAAVRLGLPGGTPVAIAGHDHLAAAIGAGVTKPGDALDSMGNAEATLLVTGRPVLEDEVRRGGFSTGCHAIDGLAYVVGGLQSSGALVEWFLDTFLGEAALAGPRTAPAARGGPTRWKRW